MRRDLPAGTVTFLFTDIEGSTRLLHSLGPDGYAEALEEHRRVLRDAFAAHGGVEIDTQGDAFFVAFPSGTTGALDAPALCSTNDVRCSWRPSAAGGASTSGTRSPSRSAKLELPQTEP